jgi:hypothetical protein
MTHVVCPFVRNECNDDGSSRCVLKISAATGVARLVADAASSPAVELPKALVDEARSILHEME